MRKFFDLINPGGLLILGRTDPMPFVEQNIFLPTSDNIFFPLSNEERICQKPLTLDQREKILMNFPDEILFCEWCGKPFFTIKKLKEHLEHTYCQNGYFSCFICRKDLFSKTGLIAHLKYSHYIDRSNEISLIFNKNRQF